MPNSVFVGRETELSKLNTLLGDANQGKSQVIFIAGEAGAGKSSLVAEFIRREQAADPNLIASIGVCNAQTGIADPYLPFRQVLTALTDENEKERTAKEADEDKKLKRWREFVQVSTKTLIMLGPDLVGIFVPGAQIVGKIGMAVGLSSDVSKKLSDRIVKKSSKESPKIDSDLDQEKIFEQYTAVLKGLSKDHTLVLVLDDLQWADSGSINLFFHLVRQIKDSRILLVGTYRPDDIAVGREGGRHPLEPIINELKRYNGDIVLDLSQSESTEGRSFVDALVDSEPNHLDRSFRDELYAHTGGQPLFTTELLRTLKERGDLIQDDKGFWEQCKSLDWNTLPARVEGVVGERIARLPADLRETLTIASVVGVEFSAQVVGRVQKVDEHALIQNLARELDKRYRLVLEEDEIKVGRLYLSQYRFTHVLIQQYMYSELSKGERRLFHSEIAEILEEVYADQKDEIALQLAHHFEAGGNEEKAIAYLIIVGDDAFCIYAYEEAILAYTRLLNLTEFTSIPIDQLTHVYLQRGRALELNSQFDLALQNYNEMLLAAQKRSEKTMELAATLAASTLYSTPTPVADQAKGRSMSEETLVLARQLDDRPAEAKALWNLQLVNLFQNKAAEAIECGEEALSIARELNLREQMAYVLSDLAWAYGVACDFDKAQETMQQGVALWRELGNKPMLASTLNTSLYTLYWTGKFENLLSIADESYQISSSINEVWNQATARNFQGLVWFDYGKVDDALAALEESIALVAKLNPNYANWYHAMLYNIYGELGALDDGMRLYQSFRLSNKDIPDAPMRTATLVSCALFEINTNQLDKAAATLADCKPDAPPWESGRLLAECRLAIAIGDFPKAIAKADSAIELISIFKLGQHLPEAIFLKGKCLYLQGDLQGSKIALQQSLSEAKILGSRRLQWQIISMLAELEPDKDLAAGLNTEARKIVDYIANHITDQRLRETFLHSTGLM